MALPFGVSGMKVTGWLMIASSLISVAIDALNGGGFDFNSHYIELMGLLQGAGLIRTKIAIETVK